MKNSATVIMSMVVFALFIQCASGYVIRSLTYRELFDLSDLVVIATPQSSRQSDIHIALDQPDYVLEQIQTIDTLFSVDYVVKGHIDATSISLLHLNMANQESQTRRFGALGTFFIDFDDTQHGNKSYLLFLKEHESGKYISAWWPLEGIRAIIPIRGSNDYKTRTRQSSVPAVRGRAFLTMTNNLAAHRRSAHC